MTRRNHTEIVCILDRSGSMEAIRSDAIGGFNAFIEQQRQMEGTASVSLVLFDDKYEVPLQSVDIDSVLPLTAGTFVPRGSTALLDAIGRTINEFGAWVQRMDEGDRPEKVIMCILTDGQENSSKEFDRARIREMIDRRRAEDNWEFAFLAANQDAFAEAGSMGFANNMIANFQSNSEGTRDAYKLMNMMTTEYRSRPPKAKKRKGH